MEDQSFGQKRVATVMRKAKAKLKGLKKKKK
jgi:hypothetical protein